MSDIQPFPDSHLWTRRYQRNNKQAGLKNLRCFPYCSDQHKIRGFCGNGVVITMSSKDPCLNGIPVQSLRCWAAFVPLKTTTSSDRHDDESKNSGLCSSMCNYEYDISVGQIVNEQQIKRFTRTPSDPFNPWFPGERVKDLSDPSIDARMKSNFMMNFNNSSNGYGEGTNSGPSVITFSINRSKRGWHYGWIANKHTCDEPHILRAYICASIPGSTSSLRCIARFDSPSFTIFCRRRLRDHVVDLPEQLKSIEHMQLRKKEFQAMIEQDPSILLKLKEKEEKMRMQMDDSNNDENEEDGDEDGSLSSLNEFDSPPNSNKRKRLNNEKDPLKSVDIDMSGENVKPTEKKMKKNRGKASNEVKRGIVNNNPFQSSGSSDQLSMIDEFAATGDNIVPLSPSASGESENDFFLSLADELLIDSANPFVFEDINEAAMPIFPISPVPRPRSNSNIESKEDLILRIMSALVQISESNESEGNNPASSLSSSNILENGTTEDIADYLDSFLKSDIKNQMDVSFDTTAISAQSKNIDEVLKSLAHFLIKETDFSNEISKELISARENLTLSDDETQSPKQMFISVLEKHLNSFLSKYSLVISDLDNMISSSKYSKLGNTNSFDYSAEDSTSIDNHLRYYTTGPHSMVSSSQMKLNKAKSNRSESRQETASRLMAAINKTFDLEDLSSLATITTDDEIFEQHPAMYITGNWRRPEATLKALEKLREHAGFPWLVRKMLKEMESTFELTQDPKELRVLNRKKLLSSGFHSYEFDGKLRPFNMQNPIPGENSFSNATACAILYPPSKCVIVMQRYTDSLRLVRATTRDPALNELQSVVVIQSYQKSKERWFNQMVVNVRAIPNVIQEDISESKRQR